MGADLVVKVHYGAWLWQPLAKGKGVHREVKSEGSRRQNLAPRNANRITQVQLDEPATYGEVLYDQELQVYMRRRHERKVSVLTRELCQPLKRQKSAEAILTAMREGPNIKQGTALWNSQPVHQSQKASQEAYEPASLVKPDGRIAERSMGTLNDNDRASDTQQLMEKVVARDNMLAALRRVESNKGAPGSDGMTVEDLRDHLEANCPAIKTSLISDAYKPQPVRRVEIPKPDGGVRLLGIPNVVDRLIQQAILQVLTPIFDPTFSESSFSVPPETRRTRCGSACA